MSSTIDPVLTLASLRREYVKITAIGASMLSIAIVSVGLRLISKSLTENQLGLDDVFICLALLFQIATESLNLRG